MQRRKDGCLIGHILPNVPNTFSPFLPPGFWFGPPSSLLGYRDTKILMSGVSFFHPTCGYSSILSNMKSNYAIRWSKRFTGFHFWRTKLKLSGTIWNVFHYVALLSLSCHTSWKILPWEVLRRWLNTLKIEPIFPTPMTNPTTSLLPRLTASPSTSCLAPSLSGICHQVFSFCSSDIKCTHFFPSLLSLSVFLCSIQGHWQL